MTEIVGVRGPSSGRYAVRVNGHLHVRWATRFGGMTLTRVDDGTTLLEGVLADQAALHDVLRSVRDLGLPLISVTRLDGPSALPEVDEENATER